MGVARNDNQLADSRSINRGAPLASDLSSMQSRRIPSHQAEAHTLCECRTGASHPPYKRSTELSRQLPSLAYLYSAQMGCLITGESRFPCFCLRKAELLLAENNGNTNGGHRRAELLSPIWR